MKLTLTAAFCALSLAAQTNVLTPEEKADGWILLFDGKSLNGWTQGNSNVWRVENGVLKADTGEPFNLRSEATFADFILKIDYRTGSEGNSGIFLRSALEGQPHITGYELQIWNESPTFPTGGLVNHVKAKPVNPSPDQWHTFEVQVKGDHFLVKLDGDTVLDAKDSKSSRGHIYLQYNRRPIEFRNIKIKRL